MAMTSYVILMRSKDSDAWAEQAGRVDASSADAAIRSVSQGKAPLTYVAVPARSWHPAEAGTETRQMTFLRRAES